MTSGLGFDAARAQYKRRLEAVAKQIAPEVAGAMADRAAAVVRQMRSLVPVKRGWLRAATDWTFGDPPKDAKFAVTAHRVRVVGQFLRVSVFSGSFKAFYARWVEFGTQFRAPGKYRAGGGLRAAKAGKLHDAGTRGHPATRAQPYFWPVWRANMKANVKAIRDAMRRAIKKGVTVH